jgi:hypothetical protein
MAKQGGDVLTHIVVAGALPIGLSAIIVMAQRSPAGLSKLGDIQSCQTKRRMAHELRPHECFRLGGKYEVTLGRAFDLVRPDVNADLSADNLAMDQSNAQSAV